MIRWNRMNLAGKRMKWSIQDVQERMEELMQAAEAGRAQILTARGKEVAAVISMDDYRELTSQAEPADTQSDEPSQ